jgi:hypothetical protein
MSLRWPVLACPDVFTGSGQPVLPAPVQQVQMVAPATKRIQVLCCKPTGTCRCEAVYFRRSSLPHRLGDCFPGLSVRTGAAQTAARNDTKVGFLIFATDLFLAQLQFGYPLASNWKAVAYLSVGNSIPLIIYLACQLQEVDRFF